MDKKIAILITVFNRKDKTLKCLNDLYLQQGINRDYSIEVYLTNDGCTDGTPEEITRRYPEVHIINGDGSLFWNRGMYTAWVEAAKQDYDFYLWLNDDTFLYADCISRLLAQSSVIEDRGIIVGSTCATMDKNKITYGGFDENGLITELSKPHQTKAINGNIVLISKNAYKQLGTNDPYFRHSLGDTDYGLRARENGIPCITGVGVFGECDQHEKLTTWMDPSQSFNKRWVNFMSPTGNNPFEFFYFKRKHFGVINACFTFISNWVHFFLPWVWCKYSKKWK